MKTLEHRLLINLATEVVDMFDQANTGGAIEVGLGYRGKLLKDVITALRRELNPNGQQTILTEEQAE